jgi:hypothetical protein
MSSPIVEQALYKLIKDSREQARAMATSNERPRDVDHSRFRSSLVSERVGKPMNQQQLDEYLRNVKKEEVVTYSPTIKAEREEPGCGKWCC